MSRRARAYRDATAAKRGELLAQDISPELTAWLGSRPDAMLHAREASRAIAERRADDEAQRVEDGEVAR